MNRRLIHLFAYLLLTIIPFYSQDIKGLIKALNIKHNPYHDIELSMNLDSLTVSTFIEGNVKSRIDKKFDVPKVFKILLGRGGCDVLHEKVVLNKDLSDLVRILLKYIRPWYCESFLEEDIKIYSQTEVEIIFQRDYIYKSTACYNRYLINKGILKSMEVFTVGSGVAEVRTSYIFIESDDSYYIKEWRSENLHHGFEFNAYFKYVDIIKKEVPVEIIIETKAKEKVTQFIYKFSNHLIK